MTPPPRQGFRKKRRSEPCRIVWVYHSFDRTSNDLVSPSPSDLRLDRKNHLQCPLRVTHAKPEIIRL
jgi:hypothetical protein